MLEKINHIELLQQCKKGNRKYQKLLYDTFAKEMYSVCLSYAKDRGEAKDYLQEGFIKVFKNLHQYKNKGSLKNWIKKIIINNIIDNIRKERPEFSASDYIDNYASQTLLSETEENIADDEKEKLNEVESMIELIPAKARAVLNLYALEGLSHKEISKKLDISIGTSKSQLNRARFLLNKYFKK